jgi:peptide deformylase
MIHDIVLYPDRRLETPCDPVEKFDTSGLHRLVADLFESMYFHQGLGLAAPQIGIMQQVAVIDPSYGNDPNQRIVLINPIITEARGVQCSEEGCLSFPGFIEQINRSMTVIVDAMDVFGTSVQLKNDGVLARALQHEIDHLNGILFIRRMSSLKRTLVQRKIRKMLRAADRGSKPGIS